MTYLFAVLGLLAIGFLMWRAFGPQSDGGTASPLPAVTAVAPVGRSAPPMTTPPISSVTWTIARAAPTAARPTNSDTCRRARVRIRNRETRFRVSPEHTQG